MTGDFTVLEQASGQGARGGRLYNVAAGTPILAGEPVELLNEVVGAVSVQPMVTSKPLVSTSAGVEGTFVGIAATNSTNTTTAAGTVLVTPVESGTTYLATPTQPASWTPQSTYNTLVGKRVTINNSNTTFNATTNIGSYTVNASDSANNGVSVQALDISKYPGKVAVVFRKGTSNLL